MCMPPGSGTCHLWHNYVVQKGKQILKWAIQIQWVEHYCVCPQKKLAGHLLEATIIQGKAPMLHSESPRFNSWHLQEELRKTFFCLTPCRLTASHTELDGPTVWAQYKEDSHVYLCRTVLVGHLPILPGIKRCSTERWILYICPLGISFKAILEWERTFCL